MRRRQAWQSNECLLSWLGLLPRSSRIATCVPRAAPAAYTTIRPVAAALDDRGHVARGGRPGPARWGPMVYAWVMRSVLVVALAGCGFHGAEVSDARVIDGPADIMVDHADPDMVASTFCDPITGLVACYEFEGTANDATANRLDATATNVTFSTMGQVGSAMVIAANSSATVAAST